MKTYPLVLLIVLMFIYSGIQAKKVCIVKNLKDADICVNITTNRAIAEQVIVFSKEKYKSGSNIWVITEPKDAEIKVYYSDTPEKIKVFISKNQADRILKPIIQS